MSKNLIFKPIDFQNDLGESATPIGAAEIANAKLQRLVDIFLDDSLPTDDWAHKIERELGDLIAGKPKIFPGHFHFEKLGSREGEVKFTAKTEEDFLTNVKSHLLSSEVDFVYHPEVSRGEVFVGGIRAVGVFTRTNAHAV